MKQAVCILIRNKDGEYLGVARRENHTEWGLPGGKVDPGEDHVTAIVRELLEETSLIVQPDEIYPVFTGVCYGVYDKNHYMATTFIATVYEGTPQQCDTGPVEWMTREDLLNGVFGSYNKALFQAVDFYKEAEEAVADGDIADISLDPASSGIAAALHASRYWHGCFLKAAGYIKPEKESCVWAGIPDLSSSSDELASVLALVLSTLPDDETLSGWNEADREATTAWIGAVHMDASDNCVDIPPAPQCLKLWAAIAMVTLPCPDGKKAEESNTCYD